MQNKQLAGFTLFELIIYLTIVAVVGTVGGAVLTYALNAKTAVGRHGEVQNQTQRALLQIVDRVHASQGITSAASALTLKMSNPAKDPTVFALSSGAVTIQEGAGSAVAITPSSTVTVSSLAFTKIDNPSPATSSVRIVITASYNNNGVADPNTRYTLQTTAAPL